MMNIYIITSRITFPPEPCKDLDKMSATICTISSRSCKNNNKLINKRLNPFEIIVLHSQRSSAPIPCPSSACP